MQLSNTDENKEEMSRSQAPPATDLNPGLAAHQTISFDPEDLSWDVGPHFMYWPLQNLDALASRKAPRPIQTNGVFAPEFSQDPEALALQPPDLPGSGRSDRAAVDDPFTEQQDLYDGTGGPVLFFHDSPGFQQNQPPLDLQQFEYPDNPRSPGPMSSVPSARGPDNDSRPASRGTLDPPLASPQNPSSHWTCGWCNKEFSGRTAFRWVAYFSHIFNLLLTNTFIRKHIRYHVRPYSCPTCHKEFSFTKDLRRHQQTRGHGGQDVKELLSCPFEACKFKFKACRRDTYKRHCRLVHEPRLDRVATRNEKSGRRNGEDAEENDRRMARILLLNT